MDGWIFGWLNGWIDWLIDWLIRDRLMLSIFCCVL